MEQIPHVAGFNENDEPMKLRKPHSIPCRDYHPNFQQQQQQHQQQQQLFQARHVQNFPPNYIAAINGFSNLNVGAKEFTPKSQEPSQPQMTLSYNYQVQQQQQQHHHNQVQQQQQLQHQQQQQINLQRQQQQQSYEQLYDDQPSNFFPRNKILKHQLSHQQPQNSMKMSVQNRLNIGNSDMNSQSSSYSNQNYSNNFYQTNHHHQSPQQSYHHNSYSKNNMGSNGGYNNSNNYRNSQQFNQQENNSFYSNKTSSSSFSENSIGGNNSAAGGDSACANSGSALEDENAALNYLQQVIQILNENPGKFDSIATHFVTIFEGMEDREYVMTNAMEDIFKMSVETPNFRYMGAKLYNLLHMLNPKPDSFFQTLLKYKLEYHQAEMQQKKHDNLTRETALFLAELYMQLRTEGRMLLIAQNIVSTLQQLLLSETADNMRCICMTLKLAGYDLSMDCPEEMKQVINSLEKIESRQPGRYPIIGSVLSLQQNNWGRKTSLTPDNLSEADLAAPFGKNASAEVRMSDEPVFYGPDGTELTAEETEFIKGVLPEDDDDDLDQDDDVDFDPEIDLDEETANDYKEFLKLKSNS